MAVHRSTSIPKVYTATTTAQTTPEKGPQKTRNVLISRQSPLLAVLTYFYFETPGRANALTNLDKVPKFAFRAQVHSRKRVTIK